VIPTAMQLDTKWAFLTPVSLSGQPPFNLSLELPPGDYTCTATCYSPQGVATGAGARVRITQYVSAEWRVNTTSTFGQTIQIPDGGLVTWEIDALFDQTAVGIGADECDVESYGYTGTILLDGDNVNHNFQVSGSFSPQWLWSNMATWGVHMPSYFPFGAFVVGDPHNSPIDLPYADGYKWKLTCRNADETKTTFMYGTRQ
jgi:hypothetical protein